MTDNPSKSIDHETLNELREMTDRMFHRIIQTYVADAANYIRKISEALGSHDFVGVQKAAHALKSASGQMGALRLQKLLGQLEDAAENNAGGIHEIFDCIKTEYEIVRVELSQIIGQP